jgi:hypothetical protein
MKTNLQKKDGLTYNNLKRNIQNVIEEIPKTTFTNIFKGSYERNIEKPIYKVGVLNFQRCKTNYHSTSQNVLLQSL